MKKRRMKKIKKLGALVLIIGICLTIGGMFAGVSLSILQETRKINASIIFFGLALICFGFVILIRAETFRIKWHIGHIMMGALLFSFACLFVFWGISPESAMHALGYSHF